MKKIYLLFSALIIINHNYVLKAQSELWGVTAHGGSGEVGTLFGMTTGGTSLNTVHTFTGTPGSSPQHTKLLQAANGKLYGMTHTGGFYNQGVLFEYDITTNTYIKKVDFNSTIGTGPRGGLMQASNGKLYGMTEFGGVNNLGVIFEYDITTNTLTKLVDFSAASGNRPYGALMQAANGKLYGLTRFGGANSLGTIFEYDISLGVFTKKFDFQGVATGSQPYGHLVEAGGKLYGVTSLGGANNQGVLFEYDHILDVYSLKVDFVAGAAGTGVASQGSLMLASNGKLYGMQLGGGANGVGAIFHYHIGSNTYTRIYSFVLASGGVPRGALIEGTNGLLYGMTSAGGSNNGGVIFSLDTTSFTYTNHMNLVNNASVGSGPLGSLIQAANGKLYGLTTIGGTTGGGVLFEYDIPGGTYTKRIDLNTSQGVYPSGHLVQAPNGKLYGLAVAGGTANSHVGVIYEYDRGTSTYTKKIELTSINGTFPYGSLVAANNGKLYGITSAGGSSGLGTLFEYNYSTNAFLKRVDLTNANGSGPYGSLMQASNGKLYGLTRIGGANGVGVLFEFDVNTNTYLKRVDFSSATHGANPHGSLVESGGKLYGMTQNGGANGVGTIFEYDFVSNVITKKIDLVNANGGQPTGSLVKADNGLLYGMTRLGGSNNLGVIFEYDPVGNIYTKKIDFSGAANGSLPYGSMIKAANGLLYGITNAGGSNSVGVIFEYNTTSNSLTKKLDFNGTNGAYPAYTQLTEVCTLPELPGAVASSTNALCLGSSGAITYSISAISNATSYVWTLPSGASILSGSASASMDANLSGVAVGTQTLGVAGVNICGTGTMGVTSVTIHSLPVISVNSGTICQGDNFIMNPSGAGAGGSYSFSTGSATVTPLSNSTYSVIGTTSAGCVASSSAIASVTVNPLPTISVNSGTMCTGQTFILTPGGAGAGGTYTIQGGSASVSPPSSTTYTVMGTTAGGCTSAQAATASVNVFATPVISVNSGTMCTGQTFIITPSGAGVGGTYTIQGGSANVSPPSSTTYTVMGTTAAGCTSTVAATSNVNVFATPVISVNSGTMCTGQSFVMVPSGAGAGGTYTFSSGSATVSPPFSTTYSVNGTTAAGCSSTVSAISIVNVFNTPVITVNSGTMCTGQNFIMTPSGAGAGGTYTFQGGSATVSPPSSTTYTVMGTTSAGCTSTVAATSTVNVFATPVISVNSGSICTGQNFTMSASGAGAGGTYTYQGGSAIVSPPNTTSYTVMGTTGAGCTSTVAAISNVTVFNTPVISVNSGSICQGKSFTITPSGAGVGGLYTITGGAFVVSPLSTSSYTVSGTTSNGCSSTVSAISNVTVHATPVVAVNSGSICTGKSFTIVPTGAGPGGNYTISGGNIIVNPTSNTSYSVYGTSSVGCVSSNTVISSVTVAPLPIVTATGGAICIGQSIPLIASGANTYTYNGGSSILTGGSPMNVNPVSTTVYTVFGTDGNGCVSSTPVFATVVVNPLPLISVSGATAICTGETTTLTALGASTYTWAAVQNAVNVVSPLATTVYTVMGTDNNGCTSGGAHTLVVNPLPTVSVLSGAICPGNSFTLTPSGASTYSYSGGSAVVNPSVTTTYSVIGYSQEGCESAGPAVATVSVVNILTVTISGNTSMCLGGTVNLTANGASTYSWSTGTTTNTLEVSPVSNTTYTVVGSSGTCYDTTFVSITVNDLPVITVSGPTTICESETAILTASGASSYSWNTNQSVATITVTPTFNTTYIVVGTDANNCVGAATVAINVDLCIGVAQHSKANELHIYPNPNSGSFVIEVSSGTEMKVLNALGQSVLEKSLTEGKNDIEINDQAKGVYFVQLKHGGQVKTVKIIKQ